MQLMLLALARHSLIEAFQESAGVLRPAKKVCCLLQRVVLLAGKQDGIAAARGDLDSSSVFVDLRDEREEVLPGLARAEPLPNQPADRKRSYARDARTATPGRSSKPVVSVLTTIRSRASAVAAINRSCAPRGRPLRRVCASSAACDLATSRS